VWASAVILLAAAVDAGTETCHTTNYRTISGTTSTATLAGSEYEAIDNSTFPDKSSCCQACASIGSGASFCFGFRFDGTDAQKCVLLLVGFSESGDITLGGTKVVHMRDTADAPTGAPTATPTVATCIDGIKGGTRCTTQDSRPRKQYF
jgi:hypothetical protein